MNEHDKKTRKFHKLLGNVFLVLLITFALITAILPDRDYSVTEKRALAQFPKLTLSSLMDGSFMEGIESWEADQFPFRDKLMPLKTQIDLMLGAIRSQGVYRCTDGSLMEAFTMPSDELLQQQTDAITGFASRYSNSNYYFCLVPNAILIEKDKLPKAAITDDQNLYMNHMADAFSSFGTFVDLREIFQSNKEQTRLYYRSDHHWTTDAAYLAWQELSSKMELNSTTTYTSGVVCNTFAGSLIASSGFPVAQYDAIKIYIPDTDPIYTVTYDNAQKMTASVYSLEHASGDNPYELFLGGNHPKITIKTAADTDRKLLIMKDSYANCMIPFLLSDFAQITIIDARYYYDDLDMEMQSAGYTDVLFLYNVNTLSKDNCLAPVLNNEQGEEASNLISDGLTPETSDTDTNLSDSVTRNIADVAFIGDSRTLTMASGGRLEFKLLPKTSVFATWGGKVTDKSALDNVSEASASHKDMAVFWYGINDVQGNPNTRDDASLFRSNYEILIDAYRKDNPDSEIVILSILTTSIHEKDYYDKQNTNIKAYNTALLELCKEKGYRFIDLTDLYTGDSCFAEGDYIHFSKEWYENSFLPTMVKELNLTL